jgi:ketosteroid isomerase-like protein
MKRIFSLMILAVATIYFSSCATTDKKETSAATPAASPTPTENVEQAITKLEHDWAAASVKADMAATDRIVADDWIGTSWDGQIQPKSQIVDELKTGVYKPSSMNVDNIKVRVFGDVAVATLTQTEKSQYKGKDTSGRYLYTDVWVKRNGSWQVVSSHGCKPVQAKS